MERHDWETAAQLPILTEVDATGGNDQLMNAVALGYWARVIGAARSDKLEQAEVELVELEKIAVAMPQDGRVWGRNTSEVFRLQAASWLALAKGERNRAEELMRVAAGLEDQTDKSSISPGRVLPAHEQLGDLLAELDRPQEALAAYEESMTHAPGRFNTYLGAARAADAAGKTAIARDYYEKLLEVVSDQGDRPEIAEAHAAID
jgi:tetratricopeptide (TPR) repeat protein